jgi:hypothetical protein
LGVGLSEHRVVDSIWIDPAGVRLRLDREQAGRPDQDMVDVAATRRGVVDREPALRS